MMEPAGGAVGLRAGKPMPRVGLGVFQSGSGAGTRDAVRAALAAGYRHVDTATIYRNEAEVGEGVRTWCDETGTDRARIFVTTKLWNDDHGYDEALRAYDRSTAALGLGKIDLYLLHWPMSGKRLDSWRALERLFDEGRVGAIGVSNFTAAHLGELLGVAKIVPHVNQVELHPLLPQPELVAFCRAHAIQTVAYSPLTKGRRLDDPVLASVAARRGATPAQVLLAWGLAQGHVVLPKSTNPARIAENLAAANVRLEPTDLAELATLARDERTAWDPTRVP